MEENGTKKNLSRTISKTETKDFEKLNATGLSLQYFRWKQSTNINSGSSYTQDKIFKNKFFVKKKHSGSKLVIADL